MRSRFGLMFAVMVSVLALIARPALAAAGDLDSTFDFDGKVVTDFTTDGDSAGCVVIQPDGKIVAIGNGDGEFAVARYNSDGSLDSSFDGDGKVLTDFGSGFDGAYCGALQSDGKIVAAGSAGNGAKFAMVRYNSDGTLDTSFSSDGKTRTDLSSGLDEAYGVVIQG
ncbi:MAG TPA: delta-60 repeat domain-containing protein, partial [Actinomycetota bacterium]|nr:delta-60 repeat domain-containing protein [Actinomycetota bacterium]